MLVTISFEEPEFDTLVKLAMQTGMTVEQYVYHCILERIEDEYDFQCCAEAKNQMQTDPQTYTLSQAEEFLGIKEWPTNDH